MCIRDRLEGLLATAPVDADTLDQARGIWDTLDVYKRQRQHTLLAGRVADGPPLVDRLERLRHGSDTGLVEFLLHQAA